MDERSNRLEILEKKVKKIEEKVDKNTDGLREMMKKMQGELDRMKKENFLKCGSEESLGKTQVNGLHLNRKESK